MNDILNKLYNTISDRKQNPEENSYTCYLFNAGIDKILKKVGEECAETIIAAKNENSAELTLEICDLLYHLLVMMNERGIPMSEIEAELTARSEKIGNLKKMKNTDKNT